MDTVYKDRIATEGGLVLRTTAGNVHDTTPTAASLVTEFATAPVATGAFELRCVNDAAGSVNFYLVASDGTSYFYVKLTKAV